MQRKSDDEDNNFIDVRLNYSETESETESEFESEEELIPLPDTEKEMTCSDIKYAIIFTLSLIISLPALIHVHHASYPVSNSSQEKMKVLIKFEIAYELILLAVSMYVTSPIWLKYITRNSSLQSLSIFTRESLSGSFDKRKRDAELKDEMNVKSDCEMDSRAYYLTKTDCSINAETPLNSGRMRSNYTFMS